MRLIAPFLFGRSGRSRALRLVVALSAVALIGAPCPVHIAPMSAGICVVDISPISPSLVDEYEAAFGGSAVVNHTDPIYIAGFGDNRQATGYHDRLWARGVVVDGADGRVAIVSVDLVGYSGISMPRSKRFARWSIPRLGSTTSSYRARINTKGRTRSGSGDPMP